MPTAAFLVVRASLAALLACCGVAAAEVSPNWYRSPALSPDGTTVVFTHAGDLYSVPVEGGRATPLTIGESYETRPVWSPDGEHIAFASDRHGNFDVFIMPSSGGEARRLTFHSADDDPSDFTPDGKAVIFESSRTDDAECVLFPSGVLAELYSVSVEGGTPSMLLTTPALNARYDSTGERMLYEDRKGYENALRKHHTSSVARDVWLYDVESGEHTKLTSFAGEDRDPHFAADEESMYFLSEREGDFNVFRMPLEPGADATQLTSFEDHPVRHLSHAARALAFSWHGEIYHMPVDGKPRMIPIEIAVDGRLARPAPRTVTGGVTEFAASPNGKEIAFVARGDVFVTSVDFRTTRAVTNTPQQERSVQFSPDGRSLVYAGERRGSWNIYRASLVDDDELYFFSATKIEEEPLVETMAESFQPQYSPDGEKVAYLHNRTTLRVLDLETGDAPVVLPGDAFYSYSDGDYQFEWSPDSRWLAVHFYNRGRAFVSEIGLVAADGSTEEPNDLTKSGYNDVGPNWAMEGGAILWASDRYGERAHGSWGAEYDVMASFLTQDAHDRFRLSKEEYTLQKELEEKREKEPVEDAESGEDAEESAAASDEGDEAIEEEEDEVDPIEIDLDGMESRIVRMTIHSSDLGGYALSPEGDALYYLARFESGYDLWKREIREESTRILVKLNAGSAAMQMTEDGSALFLLADGSLSKIDPKSGERTGISFSGTQVVDETREREYLLDHVWRQTLQKFYRPDMHGVDWRFYREQYEPKLEGVSNNRDLAEVLSELLGELNASHTGAYYISGGGDGAARTSSLGLLYDNDFAGPGMRIVEVLQGGPLDRAELDIEAGMVITHVDGVAVEDANFYRLLDGKARDRVRLTLRSTDGAEHEEVVKPGSLGEEDELRYRRWVRTRRDHVEEISDGRLGYVHVRGMNDASFRQFYSEVLGRHFDKEAIIVDTRFNGGGWLHDDLATFLTGENYVNLYPRNDEAPGIRYFGEPANRWSKPSIVVMSESNYSDAHFFPWVYTELEIGDTVGMPVPGTATAVWWERLHTGDLVFGIPQVGTKGLDGKYLENRQLEPTHLVRLDPESAEAGVDTQIDAAVEILLEQLDDN